MSDTESYVLAQSLFIILALVAFGIDRFAFHTVEKKPKLIYSTFLSSGLFALINALIFLKTGFSHFGRYSLPIYIGFYWSIPNILLLEWRRRKKGNKLQ